MTKSNDTNTKEQRVFRQESCDKLAEALRLAYEALSGSSDKTLLPRAHRAVEQALAAHDAEQAQEPVLQDIEQYRMQMAGISTAAMGYWKEGDGIHPDYDTVALRDVAKLYAKYDQLFQQKQAAQAVPAGFKLVPVEFIEAGQRIAQEYARTNPKWPMWDNGEAEPKVQDPCGVHAWLEQAAMLAAAPAPEAPTRSQRLADAGFTARDTRLECEECGAKVSAPTASVGPPQGSSDEPH